MQSYKDLTVWQKGITLVTNIYRNTRLLPTDELYGLVSQMRRSAVSIPSNIAEGYNRRNRKEYIQFLRIAYGSAGELDTQIIIVKELYPKVDFMESADLLEQIQKMQIGKAHV